MTTSFDGVVVETLDQLVVQSLSGPTGARFSFEDEKGRSDPSPAQLLSASQSIANALRSKVASGAPVLLAMASPRELVSSFFGCVLAGVVPVPLAAPAARRESALRVRFEQVRARTGATAVIVSQPPEGVDAGTSTFLGVDELLATSPEGWEPPRVDPDATAYLQFTSGSSGAPRGAVLSHRAVLHNLETIRAVFGHDADCRIAGWLPLHHDMGLVGHVLQPLYVRAASLLLRTHHFPRDPLRWLRALEEFGATDSGAPPFAYRMCIEALARTPEASFDLRRWERAYVGAEPVPPALLADFGRAFAPHGFRASSWLPCYGLAESTLFVAGARGAEPTSFDHASLATGRPRLAEGAGRPKALLGYHIDEARHPIRIVSDADAPVRDGAIGEILVGGGSLASGYYDDRAGSEACFPSSGWLRTGDLGFIRDGRLYVTGRRKNIVIVRGVCHAVEDLEQTILEADPDHSRYAVACLGVPGPDGETLVVVRETSRSSRGKDARIDRIRAALNEVHGLVPTQVKLVSPGSIPRTTSGKIARQRLSANVLHDEDAPVVGGQTRPAAEDPGVAVVGMACRFPLATDDPAALWELLLEGKDAITEVPPERWDVDLFYDPRPAMPGRMNTRWGGFVSAVDRFDARFFDIAPHEAVEMDPQQRLLLEVAWRAFEDAGIPREALQGSRTGVFVGVCNSDYLHLKIKSGEGMEQFNAYSGLGNADSIAANRISYCFDLRGPSVAIDTACSSSLTALHLAAQSIRNGECDVAIAGGVNLVLTPGTTVTLSQFGMMSPQGRCKTFDASADGYVRSEGCGLVVLRRGDQALARADRIRAWVRGSATGQDGRSRGITAPNPEAQHEVITRALAKAGWDGRSVGYVEAHGTGTPVGDPVEVEQLRRVYGARGGETCWVGSIKSNIGHLESAAGIAGFIKAVLVVGHGIVPPQIHLQHLNPAIDLHGSRLAIPQTAMPWPSETPRRAAVSSFGFGGANVHVVLEEHRATRSPWPEPPLRPEGARPLLWPLSAKSEEALARHARTLAETLREDPGIHVQSLALSAATRRSHLDVRAGVVTTSRRRLLRELEVLADHPPALRPAVAPGIAFLFSGQGAAYSGMGRLTYAEEPVFRETFDRCMRALGEDGEALRAIVFAPKSGLNDVNEDLNHRVQEATVALQIALVALWRSWGIEPSLLVGHSLGELALACVAGCVSIEALMPLVVERGRLVRSLPRGGMVAAHGTRERIVETLGQDFPALSIAASNAAETIILSGPREALGRAMATLEAQAIKSTFLNLDRAFHASMMDPILERFEARAAAVAWAPPRIPWISTLTGKRMDRAPDAAYWRRHLREEVRFGEAVAQIDGAQIGASIEIGPGNVLRSLAQTTLRRRDMVHVSSLIWEKDESETLARAVADLYEAGFDIDWSRWRDGGVAPHWPPLPVHPFEGESYWLELDPEGWRRAARLPPARSEVREAPIYTVDWVPRPLPEQAPPASARARWLIIGDGGELGAALAQQLDAQGDDVFWLCRSAEASGEGWLRRLRGRTGPYRRRVDRGLDGSGYAGEINRIVNEVSAMDQRRWRVLYLEGLEATGQEVEALERDLRLHGPVDLVHVVQGLLETALRLPLWIVTENAEPVVSRTGEPSSASPTVAQAPLWGLGQTLFLEHPELRGGSIDLEPGMDLEARAEAVMREAERGHEDRHAAIRGGRRLVPQLARWERASEASTERLALDPAASYLVTGGMGGLGLRCAQWLADRGARRIVLLGRSTPPPRDTWAELPSDHPKAAVMNAVLELEASGATVRLVGCDVTDYPGVATVVQQELDATGRLGGVIHAAGVNWLRRIRESSAEELLDGMRSKVGAAWHLHALTRDMDLDLFVLFSSVAGLWGSVELGHYTASNRFLSALAHHRRAAGRKALSIDWGPWADTGMSAKQRDRVVLGTLGFRLMPADAALRAMERLILDDAVQASVADIDWQRFHSFVEFHAAPSFFAEVDEAVPTEGCIAGARDRAVIESGSPQQVYEHLLAVVRREMSAVMYVRVGDEVDIHTRFNFMGMDSLMAMAFCARLETRLGIALPGTMAYNYPTLHKVAAYLYERLRDQPLPAVDDPTTAPEDQPQEPGAAWFMEEPGAAEHRRRLYCLPHAGAGASVYAGWRADLSASAVVVPIQLPGHEERIGEDPCSVMSELVERIVDALAPRTAEPFALFGHSLGGLVAYGVAAELHRRGLPLPDPLILSGCGRPEDEDDSQFRSLPDDDFLEELRRRFGVIPESGWDEATRAALLPALRADITLVETTRFGDAPPLPCRILVLGATDDPVAPRARLLDWAGHTEGDFSVELFEGDHMFVHGAARARVMDTIGRALRRADRERARA